jgi:glutaredoxin
MMGANMTERTLPPFPSLPNRKPKTAFQRIGQFLSRFGPWIAIALAFGIYISRSFTPIEVFATEGARREFLERVGAAPSTRIIALVTEWCPACKSLEHNLRSNGVDFVKIDIESSDDGRKLFHEVYELTGSNSIPKVILDRNLVSQGRLYMELSKEGL